MTTPALQPQAALEQAVRDALRASLYGDAFCDRTFDGRPPPRAGNVFIAVWSDAGRSAGKANRTSLDQYFGLCVTVNLRCSVPFDRKVQHRDDVEARLNAIVALVHRDSLDLSIISAANILAGYRDARDSTIKQPVGFCEPLCWERTDNIREVDGSWWMAGSDKHAGVSQTAHFGRARHIQAQSTAQ